MRTKEVPLILGFISGAWVMVMTFFNNPNFKAWLTVTDKWNQFSGSMAVLIGAISLVTYHINVVKKKRGNWYLSVYMLVIIVGMTILGFALGNKAPLYNWFLNNLSSPAGSAIYALLGFYIASAAYRAFRFRSFESTVLLCSAILVLLGRAPISATIWSGFPKMATWLVDVPNAAAVRAITLGSYVGGFAMATRVLLGLERGHLGAQD